jgi:fimbrial chaperone protein
MRKIALWGLMALCAAAEPAAASTFTIAPIRVELGAAHHAAALTLTNVEDQPVVVEVRAVAWSQRDGEESLEDTHDLLVSPAVLQIPGNGSQIVRVALRGAASADHELAYRLLFDEVPQAAPAGFNGLRMSLRLSVPAFVAPAHGQASANVTWELRPMADGQFEVAAFNQGSAHLQVVDFDVQAGTATPLHAKISKYVLPGSRMTWQLKTDDATAWQGPVVVRGHSDQGEFTAPVAPNGR